MILLLSILSCLVNLSIQSGFQSEIGDQFYFNLFGGNTQQSTSESSTIGTIPLIPTEPPGYIDIGLNNVSIDTLGWYNTKESDLEFRLVTRRTCLDYQILKIGQIANNTLIKPNQPFKFITHGFQSYVDTTWLVIMTREYVIKGDYNVIQIDWSKPAKSIYPIAARYTKSVGLFIARLIADLNKNLSVPLSNIHLIGHSLGSHVMGFAGSYVQQYLQKNISRITGLDPAGPLFLLASPENKLQRNDANFVDVIHTDGGRYGYLGPLGTADFYPNGGVTPQPPCRSGFQLAADLVGTGCSHGISHDYFIESIRSEGFVSQQCTSYVAYQLEQCRFNPKYKTAIMGENISLNSTGVFYLQVNSEPPYAKN